MNLRWLPNAITLGRMLSALPLAWLILDNRIAPALWLFLLASLSDGLDGWLARRFRWQTTLGGYLDPLADKLLVLSVYLSLAMHDWLPLWLAGLVAVRDLVIVGGAFAWHVRRGPLRAEPLLLSRLNTVFQMALASAVLLNQGLFRIPDRWIDHGIWLVTISTVCSGLVYVMLWWRKKPPHEESHD